jgi:hypothetical protein
MAIIPKKKGDTMKRSRLACFIVGIMLICMMAAPAYAQNKAEDLTAIYKGYFKLLIDKDFTKAWDGLANESKLTIAELIAKEANTPSDKVLGMLNTNENGLRDKYFTAFQESIRELLDEIYNQGKFTVKSKTATSAVVIIEVQKDPKDFGMFKQDGVWKVNFFKDLMADEK